MTTKVSINLLATGVPGLDEILGGGLPEFSFNLVAKSVAVVLRGPTEVYRPRKNLRGGSHADS